MTEHPDTTPPPLAPPLTILSEEERVRSLERFRLLHPYLENEAALLEVAGGAGVFLRTARYWVRHYRQEGLAGLSRKTRRDKDRPKIAPDLLRLIEGLALQKPVLSAAAIQRQVARDRGEKPPSYSLVYAVVRKIDPALVTLAHEGTKAYCETFDLVHRREADAPNAIWQADHSELDRLNLLSRSDGCDLKGNAVRWPAGEGTADAGVRKSVTRDAALTERTSSDRGSPWAVPGRPPGPALSSSIRAHRGWRSRPGQEIGVLKTVTTRMHVRDGRADGGEDGSREGGHQRRGHRRTDPGLLAPPDRP